MKTIKNYNHHLPIEKRVEILRKMVRECGGNPDDIDNELDKLRKELINLKNSPKTVT